MKKQFRFISMSMWIATLFWLSLAHAGYEAISYGVRYFGGPTECSGSSPLDSSYDYARIFRCVAENSAGSSCKNFQLKDSGQYMQITNLEDWDYDASLLKMNGSVNWRDFSDDVRAAEFPNTSLRGGDHLTRRGADWADIVFLATHGTPRIAGARIPVGTTFPQCPSTSTLHPDPAAFPAETFTEFTMGYTDAANPCGLRTSQMALSGGWHEEEDDNRDANIFMSRACNSAHPCVWLRGGYLNMARGNWLLMHNGFYGGHGSPDQGYGRFKDYLVGAKFRRIGARWLTEMNVPHDGRENCPVSIVYCASENLCDEMFYEGGAKRFKDTGVRQISKMYFVGGCDPDGTGTSYTALPFATWTLAPGEWP